MQAPQSWIKGYFLVGMIAALSACGGSSSSSNPPPPPPPDTTPNAFSFTAVDDAEPGAEVPSDTITISGVDTETPISVEGGEYRIEDGGYTSSAGTIESGQSVQVIGNASPEYDTGVEVVLTIGGVDGSFTITTVPDLVPAVATADIDLGIREDIVITFDEPVNPETLEVTGLLAELADGTVWNSDDTKLTLTPAKGVWESGVQSVAGSVDDMVGNTTTLDIDFEIRLVLENFQEASVVIGQPDFTSREPNQGGSTFPNTLYYPVGTVTVSSGRLWVPDPGNQRILGFDGVPSANTADASWVVGQPDMYSNAGGTSASEVDRPLMAAEHMGNVYVLDYYNSRVSIFDGVPLTPPAVASNVIGQIDLNSRNLRCDAKSLVGPMAMNLFDGKLVVADTENNRVLIWNTVPEDTNAVAADLVIGQASMTDCTKSDVPSARSLFYPTSVWSDGKRLVVADGGNHRILIWNTFPTSDFQPADIVLGQLDFQNNIANDDNQDGISDGQPSARTFMMEEDEDAAIRVWSNGLQLFVSDDGNHRAMIWNEFPTQNFQPADAVIGQSDFAKGVDNDSDQDGFVDGVTARTLSTPSGGGLYRDKMFLLDAANNRALVFESR